MESVGVNRNVESRPRDRFVSIWLVRNGQVGRNVVCGFYPWARNLSCLSCGSGKRQAAHFRTGWTAQFKTFGVHVLSMDVFNQFADVEHLVLGILYLST